MNNFKPAKPEKEIISMRISRSTLLEIDKLAADCDMSRNELLNQCIEFALKNLDKRVVKKQTEH